MEIVNKDNLKKYTEIIEGRYLKKADLSSITVTGDNLLVAGEGQNSVCLKGYSGTTKGNYSVNLSCTGNASGNYSYAEGYETSAEGMYSHAEGVDTVADGQASHAEGINTTAERDASHAEGVKTTAEGEASHAEGKYNAPSTLSIHSVGVGTGRNNRKNAEDIDYDGNKYLIGVGGYDGTNLEMKSGSTVVVNTAITSVQGVINSISTGYLPLSGGTMNGSTSITIPFDKNDTGMLSAVDYKASFNCQGFTVNYSGLSSNSNTTKYTSGVIVNNNYTYSFPLSSGTFALTQQCLPLSGGSMTTGASITMSSYYENGGNVVPIVWNTSSLNNSGLTVESHSRKAVVGTSSNNTTKYKVDSITCSGDTYNYTYSFPSSSGTFAIEPTDKVNDVTINDAKAKGWFSDVFTNSSGDDTVTCLSAHIIDIDVDNKIATVRYTIGGDTNDFAIYIGNTCIGGGIASDNSCGASVIVSVPYDKNGKALFWDKNYTIKVAN